SREGVGAHGTAAKHHRGARVATSATPTREPGRGGAKHAPRSGPPRFVICLTTPGIELDLSTILPREPHHSPGVTNWRTSPSRERTGVGLREAAGGRDVYLAGRVALKSRQRRIHSSSAGLPATPSGRTNTKPAIGRPVKSMRRACG